MGSLFKRCNDCGHIGGHHSWCGVKWKEEKPVDPYPNTQRRLNEIKEVWQKPSFTSGYDAVNPPHYSRRAIEPWDYVAANKLGYFEGNAIKYITRWKDKNGLTDIRKAIRFLEKLIEVAEAEEKASPERTAGMAPELGMGYTGEVQPQPWDIYGKFVRDAELVRKARQEVGGQPTPCNADDRADTGDRT